MSALKANFSRAHTRVHMRSGSARARRKTRFVLARVSDLKIRSYNIVLPQAALFFRCGARPLPRSHTINNPVQISRAQAHINYFAG